MSVGRVARLTTLRTDDPDLNRVQDQIRQALGPVLQNPMLSAADYRVIEVQPTTNSGAPTFALQYRSATINGAAPTWSTIASWNSSGQIATPSQIVPSPAMIAPTLQNTWSNAGGGSQNAGYLKDAVGFVHIQGQVTGGTIGATVFTLPAGYRPGASLTGTCNSNSALGLWTVTAAGLVQASVGSNVFFDFSNIHFLAEK